MFGRDLLLPSLHREPVYDDAFGPTGPLELACSRCGGAVPVDVAAFLASAWSYEAELGPELADAARHHFAIGIVGKSHDGGWPSLRRTRCPGCGAGFLVYAGVREPANGWHQLTMQGGIVELVGDAPAV